MILFLLLINLLALPSQASIPASLHQKIKDAAHRSFLDPNLVEAIVTVESNFKARATSKKGAMGLMQVMPHTADACEIHEPYHALSNLMGACECLRKLINRYRGNLKLALAAYNAGPQNVEKYKGIPPFPETISYVTKIMRLYEAKSRLSP